MNFKNTAILLLLFLLGYKQLRAQPAFLNISQWHVSEIGPGFSEFPWYEAVADTQIQGLTYKKVLREGLSTSEYVREDNQQKQVWITGPAWAWQEQLLYDFDLSLGDSLSLQFPGWGNRIYRVDSTGSVNSNQGFLPLWKLNNVSPVGGPPQSLYWIRGVGARSHPFYLSHLQQASNSYQLICSFQNTIKLYDDGFGTCPNLPPPLSVAPLIMLDLKLAPNPARDQITIRLSPSDLPATLSITDLTGKVLAQQLLRTSDTEIPLSTLPTGILLFRFTTETAKFHAETVIHLP